MSELYPALEFLLAATQLTLAMAGMGLTTGPRDFAAVFSSPRAMAVGVGVQLVLIPALAVLVGTLLPVPPEVGVGLVMVAAMPGGAMSNVFTWVGRGHTALSISLTAVTTLGCLVTTSLVLRLLAGEWLPAEFSMPVGHIVREIALFLLLPLSVGMALAPRLGARAQRVSTWLIRGSFVAMAALVVGSLASGRLTLSAYGWITPVALVTFVVASLYLTHGVGWLLGLTGKETLAIGVEATMRNSNLALLLKAALFPVVAGGDNRLSDAVLFVVLYCGGTSLTVVWPPILMNRWRGKPWLVLPRRRPEDPPEGEAPAPGHGP